MTMEDRETRYIPYKRGRVRRYPDDPPGDGWNVEEVGIAFRRVQRRSPAPKGPRRVRLAPVLTSPGTETQLNFKMICAILAPVVRRPAVVLRVFRDSTLASITDIRDARTSAEINFIRSETILILPIGRATALASAFKILSQIRSTSPKKVIWREKYSFSIGIIVSLVNEWRKELRNFVNTAIVDTEIANFCDLSQIIGFSKYKAIHNERYTRDYQLITISSNRWWNNRFPDVGDRNFFSFTKGKYQ